MNTLPTPPATPLFTPLSTNVSEYTVSEISGAVKRTLEGAFGRVRVRGEVSGLNRHRSGHTYFALKDEGGKIDAVVWKTALPRVGLKPEDGVEVIATGRVSSYGERSSYQLVVERIEYAGAGALLARIEMVRQRLLAEGLFDAARKRHIPLLPSVIGVVTSPSGAVLQDIRTTVLRRFARPILVWPVPVQGEGAAERIAAAIAGFDRIAPGGPVPRPDVLIVARGGGSLEDLMAFNDETVVRAAALCRIPLISAVGHETDHTLIDLAADRRAPTPTAAAELAVPSRAALVATVAGETARLASGLHRMTQERRLQLSRAERGLPDLPSLVGGARQRLDDRAQRLGLALPNLLVARRSQLVRVERQIPDLPARLRATRQSAEARAHRLLIALPNLMARRRATLADARLPSAHALAVPMRTALHMLAARFGLATERAASRYRDLSARVRLNPATLAAAVRQARTRLDAGAARLESASPAAIQARGYALVLDAAGHVVTEAAGVAPGARLRLRFIDGETAVTADRREVPRRPAQAIQDGLML